MKSRNALVLMMCAAVALAIGGCLGDSTTAPPTVSPNDVISGAAPGGLSQFVEGYANKSADLRFGGPSSCLSKNLCVEFVAEGVTDTLVVAIKMEGYGTVAGADFEAWLLQADFEDMAYVGFWVDGGTICEDWIFTGASDGVDPGVSVRAGGFTVPADLIHCDESSVLMFLIFDNVGASPSITITDVYDDLAVFATGCGDTYGG